MSDLIEVSSQVRSALQAGLPVVALETTLVTHGFPSPKGLQVAKNLEEAVRAEGAHPATIGVLRGKLRVGLSDAELIELAASVVESGPNAAKLNLSNLGARLASGGPGSTTVAATLLAASRVGIRFFATGGLGGVHRKSEETGDISADLTALARFPVAVVCAGAKAILDLGKTVEALETLGVPIFGYLTSFFPAFYRRSSGLSVDQGFDSIDDLAQAVEAHFSLGLGSGVVVANPIPSTHEMPARLYESSLEQALSELAAKGIRGREVTPFLLARLNELTRGQSAFSNEALLMHNAQIAAKLARISAPSS